MPAIEGGILSRLGVRWQVASISLVGHVDSLRW